MSRGQPQNLNAGKPFVSKYVSEYVWLYYSAH